MIAKFINNVGGINITDSPLSIKDNQATGNSYNYNYSKTGSISKNLGNLLVNSSADAQLKTLGLPIHNDAITGTKTVVRAAGTKIQVVDIGTPSFTNQTEDTLAVNSDFLTSGSVQPVVSVNFNNVGGTVAWMAGGGMNAIYGYTGSNVTKNGSDPATGVIGLSLTAPGTGGTWDVVGVRFYAVVLRKGSTLARSNAALDTSINVDDITKKVDIDLTGLTIDTTKYDEVLIYRSVVSGVEGFTTGDLIVELPSNSTSFTDDGSSISTAEVVPRVGNTTDNSVLGSGTYKYVTTFKRRLVTAKGSTFYLSDLNKPESWPLGNDVTIPTGGPITGLAVIGYNSPFSTGTDEILVIFKQSETWMFTGTSIEDWELKYIDQVGCIGQSLVVPLNGFIAWMDYRGIYLWDGHGKPVYASRPIEAFFASDGDLDKTKLTYGWSAYVQRDNQIIWRVSHRTMGEQAVAIKMDTRFTLPQVSDEFDKRILEGVFILDSDIALYGGASYRTDNFSEIHLTGDGAGKLYRMQEASSNPGGVGVQFTYETRAMDMGTPEVVKRYSRVIAVIERLNDHDLILNYWSDYKTRIDYKSVERANMAPKKGSAPALWDVAFWDQADWDSYEPEIDYLIFNLHSNENNTEGTSLKLQFVQTEANAPVRIHGFYVEYEEMTAISETN